MTESKVAMISQSDSTLGNTSAPSTHHRADFKCECNSIPSHSPSLQGGCECGAGSRGNAELTSLSESCTSQACGYDPGRGWQGTYSPPFATPQIATAYSPFLVAYSRTLGLSDSSIADSGHALAAETLTQRPMEVEICHNAHVIEALDTTALGRTKLICDGESTTSPCRGEWTFREKGRVHYGTNIPDHAVQPDIPESPEDAPEDKFELAKDWEREDAASKWPGKQKNKGQGRDPTPIPAPNIPIKSRTPRYPSPADVAQEVANLGFQIYGLFMAGSLWQSAYRKLRARCTWYCTRKIMVCDSGAKCKGILSAVGHALFLDWYEAHTYWNNPETQKKREEHFKKGGSYIEKYAKKDLKRRPDDGGLEFDEAGNPVAYFEWFEGTCKCECEGESSLTEVRVPRFNGMDVYDMFYDPVTDTYSRKSRYDLK